MRSYGSECVFIGLYTLLDFNGSFRVLIGLYGSLWVSLGPNRYLCVFEGACGFL